MDGSAFNALLLADSRVPTGSYAYSSGLEPAIIAGLQAGEVDTFMRARLATVTPLECSACVLAWRMAAGQQLPRYEQLEQAVDARTPSAAQRHVSRTLGRALLLLAQSLELDSAGVRSLAERTTPPSRGTALGVLGAALAVSEQACAEVCCYEDLQGVASAALKLLLVTPAQATRWVIEAGGDVAGVVQRARSVNDHTQLPALCAPLMESRAEAHALRNRRLFNA